MFFVYLFGLMVMSGEDHASFGFQIHARRIPFIDLRESFGASVGVAHLVQKVDKLLVALPVNFFQLYGDIG